MDISLQEIEILRKLVEMKKKDEGEYRNFLEDIKGVIKDLMKMSNDLVNL